MEDLKKEESKIKWYEYPIGAWVAIIMLAIILYRILDERMRRDGV